MIVVVGIPAWEPPASEEAGKAVGSAVSIAAAAVAAGARVELVGKVGEDAAGDSLLIDLARAGIGHAAILRDPSIATPLHRPDDSTEAAVPQDEELASLLVAEPAAPDAAGADGQRPSSATVAARGGVLEPADLELALRYLGDFRIVVVAEALDPAAMRVVADGAAFAGAQLVALAADPEGGSLPSDATVLEPPAEDPDGDFGRLVGAYAAALDRGEAPEAAFRAVAAERGWETAG